VRQELPIVLALSASTPYRNGHQSLVLSHIARARRANGGLVAFLGDVRAAAASSCWSPPWARRVCGGQRPSPPIAPGQRHDRCPCPSPQADSRSWPALLGSQANAEPAYPFGAAALCGAGTPLRSQVLLLASPFDSQDHIDSTGDASERVAPLGLSDEHVQPVQSLGAPLEWSVQSMPSWPVFMARANLIAPGLLSPDKARRSGREPNLALS
jgi:hypothetical protein